MKDWFFFFFFLFQSIKDIQITNKFRHGFLIVYWMSFETGNPNQD